MSPCDNVKLLLDLRSYEEGYLLVFENEVSLVCYHVNMILILFSYVVIFCSTYVVKLFNTFYEVVVWATVLSSEDSI